MTAAVVPGSPLGRSIPRTGARRSADSPASLAAVASPPLKVEVVHHLPGRLRLRVPRLKRAPTFGDRLAAYLRQQPGVVEVRVSAANASVLVTYDPARITAEHIRTSLPNAATFPIARSAEALPAGPGAPRLGSVLCGAGALALGVVGAPVALTTGLLALSSLPIVVRAARTLLTERRVSVELLDAVSIGVLGGQGNLVASALAATLIEGGEYVRGLTARRSRAALSDLLATREREAWVLRGTLRQRVPVDALAVGDLVIVYPGELVPVDGTVVRGQASVDQKVLTGEATPIVKVAGGEVFASTVVTDGKLYVRAERVGTATRAAQIVQLLARAPVGDTRIANYAGRFADRLVLPTILLAGGMYVVTGSAPRAVAVLAFDLATGIRVAAPTSVLSSMTAAARRDVLIKGGHAIEKLSEVDALVFDKTGTLTTGMPRVVAVRSFQADGSSDEVLCLAAAAEQRLSHPAAEAIVRAAAERELTLPERHDSAYRVGRGIEARLSDGVVLVGSERWFAERSVTIPSEARDAVIQAAETGATMVLVARNDRLVGGIAYADVPRPEAAAVLRLLHQRGVRRTVMVTGDHPLVARAVARQVGIDWVEAEVFPEQKTEIVRALQRDGCVVGVIGDGINDSPALAYADVSVSLVSATDVARETADVVLHGDLHGLVEAIDLARETTALIRQNLAIVAMPNVAGLVLATTGTIGPLVSTAINNGSAAVAAANALRPLLTPPRR